MTPLRTLIAIVWAGLLACGAAGAQSRWTANGQLALAVGNEADASLAWRVGIHRWLRDSQALGIQAGMYYWNGSAANRPVFEAASSYAAYQDVTTDGPTLAYVAGSFRVRSLRADSRSAPYFAFGIGAYRQSVHELPTVDSFPKSRDGVVRPGGSITFGGGGIRGLTPNMEFRYDWIDTQPGPSHYFSVAIGLQFDR